MLFGNDRNELRRMYAQAWRLHQSGQPMSALEAQIATVVSEHPEYQVAVANADNRDYIPEGGDSNPYLHMGLHLAIREQVATNRPFGIMDIYQRLTVRFSDPHQAEHQMLECLAESLWEAQQSNQMPDEMAYLEKLKRI